MILPAPDKATEADVPTLSADDMASDEKQVERAVSRKLDMEDAIRQKHGMGAMLWVAERK